jgi:hypothetical protein
MSTNSYPVPSRTTFMLAGYELAETLDIRSRWETLSDEEVLALELGLGLDRLSDIGESHGESNVLRPSFGKGGSDPL